MVNFGWPPEDYIDNIGAHNMPGAAAAYANVSEAILERKGTGELSVWVRVELIFFADTNANETTTTQVMISSSKYRGN